MYIFISSWLHLSPDSYNHAFWRHPHLPETHWNPEYSYSGAYLRMSKYTHSCRGPHWETHTPLPRLIGALLLGPFPLLGCTLNLEGEKITLGNHVWIHRVVASVENYRVLWIKSSCMTDDLSSSCSSGAYCAPGCRRHELMSLLVCHFHGKWSRWLNHSQREQHSVLSLLDFLICYEFCGTFVSYFMSSFFSPSCAIAHLCWLVLCQLYTS